MEGLLQIASDYPDSKNCGPQLGTIWATRWAPGGLPHWGPTLREPRQMIVPNWAAQPDSTINPMIYWAAQPDSTFNSMVHWAAQPDFTLNVTIKESETDWC